MTTSTHSKRYKRVLTLCLALMATTVQATDIDLKIDTTENTVAIQQGLIRGVSLNNIDRYLGIPYAAPPTGDLRWKPPQNAADWSEIRDATQFGNACAQYGNFYTSNDLASFDKPHGSEDCLYLNVWAPQQVKDRPKPVLVFIHGGSGIHGAASLPLYDGQRLAAELDAVVVSINYRLGFFGFAKFTELKTTDPVADSGSFALLDQIKATEWVQQNIKSFGGDASNVTLMGHSAGCTYIWALLRSPLATGKFQKTICLSGIPTENTKEEATEASQQLLAALLIADRLIASPDDLNSYTNSTTEIQRRDYLHSKSTTEITVASQGIPTNGQWVDGHVVTTGSAGPLVNPVPTMVGTTRDEAPILLLKSFSSLNYTSLWKMIHTDDKLTQRDFFDSTFDLVKFKLASWATNYKLHSLVNESTELLEASDVPVFRFQFDWAQMPQPWKSLVGAYHGIDVPFIFGNFGLGTDNFTHFTWKTSEEVDRERIHRQLAAGIRGFIESSDPNKYDPSLNWQQWREKADDKHF